MVLQSARELQGVTTLLFKCEWIWKRTGRKQRGVGGTIIPEYEPTHNDFNKWHDLKEGIGDNTVPDLMNDDVRGYDLKKEFENKEECEDNEEKKQRELKEKEGKKELEE
ncbi:hypothetical protein BGX26_009470 [Mortierella sp. AD094]|nr:hypothetical protein BGX26_009470 [Mortierella sp. AD094]